MTDAANRRKFEALVAAAFADGYLAEAEKQVLERKAGRLGIAARDTNEIIGLGQQRKLSIGIPATAAEREALLEDLIEVVSSDGRVEAPEYSLLARFAETLKISLPELRVRVNRRMQGLTDRNTRTQTRREAPPPARRAEPAPPPPPPRRVDPAPPPPPPRSPSPTYETPQFMQAPTPMTAAQVETQHGVQFPKDVLVADLPPVTLQLLKQAIMFDNETDSIAVISRTLNIPQQAAAQIRAAILAAFPDLKPASQVLRTPPRR